jgi:hypothetical protein
MAIELNSFEQKLAKNFTELSQKFSKQLAHKYQFLAVMVFAGTSLREDDQKIFNTCQDYLNCLDRYHEALANISRLNKEFEQ